MLLFAVNSYNEIDLVEANVFWQKELRIRMMPNEWF